MGRALLAVLLIGGCRAAPPPSVVVAYDAGPRSFLPHETNDEYSAGILGNVYERVVSLDGDLGLGPGLAEAWHTPDDLTWVFRMREGVLLHDGRALDAALVARSLERARSDPASRLRAELAAVASIEAVDPRTLRVRTRFPFAPLPNRLAGVPIAAEGAQGGRPVGSGRYRVSAFRPGGDTTLEAFEAHRDGPPAVRTLTFRVIPDKREQLRRLLSGEVQLLADLRLDRLSEVASAPGLRIAARRGLLVAFVAMDCARETNPYVSTPRNPFRDVRVRRAVAQAIDREALVAGPLAGQAEVVDQIVGPQVFGYHASLPKRRHDVAEARRLLAEAGYAKGFEVDLDMAATDETPHPALAGVARDLAALGIRVRPRPNDLAALLDRVERRDTAFYLMGWISTSGDAGSSAEYLLHTPGGAYGIDNGGGYSNPEFDRLLLEASRRLDSEERRMLLRRAFERIDEDVPVVPLYRQTDLYAVARNLEFVPRLDREIRGAEMRWTPER